VSVEEDEELTCCQQIPSFLIDRSKEYTYQVTEEKC
jgi:hypothetical protein